MFTASGFNKGVKQYIGNNGCRPLALDTFDYVMRLYTDVHKSITDYNSFTFARSQGRVPMLSTPEASRSRYTSPELPAPDDEETSRLWRGFLLFELNCRMYGVPCSIATNLSATPQPVGLFDPRKLLRNLPLYVREEVRCVQEYFEAQYKLAFNCVLERFELAVGKLGQRSQGSWTHQASDTRPLIELLSLGSQTEDVSYLTNQSYESKDSWVTNMAVLGVSFLQQYLCWDPSSQLGFIRATYNHLCWGSGFLASLVVTCRFDLSGLSLKGFGWPCQPEDKLDMYDHTSFTPCEDRMRSVGWIFWKNTDRLRLMNLGSSQEYEMSRKYYDDDLGLVHPDLMLQIRPHLMETSVQRQDWELVMQEFGCSESRTLHDDTKSLFRAIGEPSICSSADIASMLARQNSEDTPTQVKASGS